MNESRQQQMLKGQSATAPKVSDYSELKKLAETIHGEGTTTDMLSRWSRFEAACKPDLILALIAEIERLTGFVVHRRAQADQYDKALTMVADQRDQLKAEIDEDKLHFQAMGQALEGLVVERDQFKAENEKLKGLKDLAEEAGNAYRADKIRLAHEVDRLRGENDALLTALKGMTSMYGYCWDLVDGGLLCMQDSVQRFEDAHEAAQKVIAAMSKGERS